MSLVPIYWNKGVHSTMQVIGELPSTISETSEKGYKLLLDNPEVKKMMDSMNAPTPTPAAGK